MTPDPTDIQTGQLRLLEPLAAALRRFTVERGGDDGLFGPRSLVWRVHRDRTFILAGVRSLLMQALHPLAQGDAETLLL